MIGYPPMEELYLGCECMDLDHVVALGYFPPKKDEAGNAIIEEDDPPVIYFHVTANNYFTRLLPSLRYFYEKYTWSEFYHYNWYQRWWLAGKYIFSSICTKKYGILDAFDFQVKDHDKLDAFLALISNDIDTDIDEKSELWLDDERWKIKFQPDRWVSKKHEIIEPWQVGWDIHFLERGFWGRIRWGFKYIFGRHYPEKEFEIFEKDAAKMRGMIKWVQEENKKNEEEMKDTIEWVQDMGKSKEGISKMKEVIKQAVKQAQEKNE